MKDTPTESAIQGTILDMSTPRTDKLRQLDADARNETENLKVLDLTLDSHEQLEERIGLLERELAEKTKEAEYFRKARDETAKLFGPENTPYDLSAFEKMQKRAEQAETRLAVLDGEVLQAFREGAAGIYKMTSEILQNRKRLAEAEKDAERYRWLREDARGLGLEEWPTESWDSPEAFDNAIDAAIAQEKK